ncbi:MAG: hypothetical protein LBQ67_03575 [Treponema sp.]|nr:hypothetical protein [Treponema sp.]
MAVSRAKRNKLLGAAAPAVGTNIFDRVNVPKTVTVRMPSGATGYGTAPADAAAGNRGNAVRGKGWNGGAYGEGAKTRRPRPGRLGNVPESLAANCWFPGGSEEGPALSAPLFRPRLAPC